MARSSHRAGDLVLGRIGGAPIVIRPTWWLLIAVIALLFGPNVRAALGLSVVASYLVAVGFGFLLLLSVLVHELAHAVAAHRAGVALHNVSATLLGGHTRMDEARTPGAQAVIAVVGPTANLVLAGLMWWLADVVPEPQSTGAEVVTLLLVAAAGWNALVGGLNLLPGLPLDGGWLLEALVWRLTGRRTTGVTVAGWSGRGLAIAAVVAVLVIPYARGGGPDLYQVAWVFLLAAFIWVGASASLRAAATERTVAAFTLAAVARPAVTAPREATLADVAAAFAGPAPTEVVVVEEGRPVGYLDRAAAAAVPRSRWEETGVVAVQVPLPAGAVVDGGLRGREALRAVAAAARRSPVMAVHGPAGEVTGLLRYADVVATLQGT